MLREYRLTNFKAFGETVTIPIRPLTLIFGANSSGKSSIFQSLLLLKQTLEEAKNPNTALLPKGSLVDLGTYRAFVHRHELDRNFEFGARFDLESTNSLVQKILEHAGSKNADISIRLSSEKESNAAALHQIDIALGDERQALISCLAYKTRTRQLLEAVGSRTDISEEDREIEIKPELEFWYHWYNGTKDYMEGHCSRLINEDDPIFSPNDNVKNLAQVCLEKLREYRFENAIDDLKSATIVGCEDAWFEPQYKNFLPERLGLLSGGYGGESFRFSFPYDDSPMVKGLADINGYDISQFVLPVCSTFRRLLAGLVYIGPLRSKPEHYYEFSGDTTDYVGQSGEYLPSILFEDKELVEQIDRDLERLGVKYKLEVPKLQYEDAGPSNIFSLRLVDKAKVDVSLRDVGFGISQVLPVVVQSRLSEKKMLLIEQPEIHLHPAHQAELGDMFIRSAKERGNTLLLETHSEHLLLRIMRRMRETSTGKLPEGAIEVRPEDVMVLFVESDGSQSIVREMPLDERGELVKAWPGGFFEEGLREIL